MIDGVETGILCAILMPTTYLLSFVTVPGGGTPVSSAAHYNQYIT